MSGRDMSVVTVWQNCVHTNEMHLLVFLTNFVHLINAWIVEHIKLFGNLVVHVGCFY